MTNRSDAITQTLMGAPDPTYALAAYVADQELRLEALVKRMGELEAQIVYWKDMYQMVAAS